jgi:hypothetical protein
MCDILRGMAAKAKFKERPESRTLRPGTSRAFYLTPERSTAFARCDADGVPLGGVFDLGAAYRDARAAWPDDPAAVVAYMEEAWTAATALEPGRRGGGKRGGAKGGPARAITLLPERRARIAQMGGEARAAQRDAAPPDPAERQREAERIARMQVMRARKIAVARCEARGCEGCEECADWVPSCGPCAAGKCGKCEGGDCGCPEDHEADPRLARLAEANRRRQSDGARRSREEIAQALLAAGPGTPEHLVAAGQLRLAHPRVSLSRLGEMSDPPLSKDAIAGRLRDLMRLAGRAEAAGDGSPGEVHQEGRS